MIEQVRSEEFGDRVLDSPLPVLVVFTAAWCGPCKWLHPHLEEVASRTGGGLRIFEVDVDVAPGLAERYRIGSVPTVMWIQGGDEVERSVGVEPDRLMAWAERFTRPGR